MGGFSIIKTGQTAHRIKHAFGVGRIGLALHNRAAKAVNRCGKTGGNAFPENPLRHQSAEPRQALRNRFRDNAVNILFGQKPHQPKPVLRRAGIIGKGKARHIAPGQNRLNGGDGRAEKRPDNNIGTGRNGCFGRFLRAFRRAFGVVQADDKIFGRRIKQRQLRAIIQMSGQRANGLACITQRQKQRDNAGIGLARRRCRISAFVDFHAAHWRRFLRCSGALLRVILRQRCRRTATGEQKTTHHHRHAGGSHIARRARRARLYIFCHHALCFRFERRPYRQRRAK